jgi:hypothetical protein
MVRRKMVRRKMVRRWLIILTHTTDQALAWHVNKYGSQRLFVISRAKTVLLDHAGNDAEAWRIQKFTGVTHVGMSDEPRHRPQSPETLTSRELA